ncbi:major facilitator superfamily domain-containing protein [Aspergillus pseudonomiae]|uniref:Major facilitator superfamily domain-containing protein n=1 Tax=Aspergillus pseudonomiae TaxID=1506151 RepID=A0A5N6HP34_9EURO|nr:major facilitator superfamily domain-containing protein [Aspergillus pseudonomiae]KAB8256186.1 major facilitator superfamily domain-containing protein [Aspergillus pseudonomiae]KAE8400770.1 major facilitator superfamily domain-containing protein [Aspergillus pseudonomiae]
MASQKKLTDAQQAYDEQIEDVSYDPISQKQQQGYHASTPQDTKLDRQLNLKLDCVIVSILTVGFLLQAVDKSNISNAATTETFSQDLHLKHNDVPNAVSLYAATFIPCMPISVMLGRIVGPRLWLPFIMVAWGVVTITQAVMKNRAQMMALRLLLGVFEAGYVPTAYYYIGTLYPAYHAGLRMGMLALSFAFSGAFAGLIAYGCFQIRSTQWKDWELLFLVEGSVTIFVAVLALAMLPNKLRTAWFLNEGERAHAIRRMATDRGAHEDMAEANAEESDHRLTTKDIVKALKDWKKVLIIVCNLCATTPAYGFAIFLPLMVKGMGYESIKANLMTVPPFMVGGVGLLTIVWLSDRFHERSGFAILSMLISIVGYIVLIASKSNKVRYGFLHVALIGSGTANPLIAAWLTDNTPDHATRAVTMGLFGLTNISAVIAGQIFRESYAPSYRISVIAVLIIVAVGLLGFAAIRGLYMLENRRRKKETENWTAEEYEAERLNSRRIGHEKKYFVLRY